MKCLIVDDDPLICDLLDHFCRKSERISDLTIVTSGFEAISVINNATFDLVLLDFDLPDIKAPQIISVLDPGIKIIMITSNREFGALAFGYENIVDYLLKPIAYDRFIMALEKVEKGGQEQRPMERKLFVKDGQSLVSLDLNELQFIKSSGNYLELVTDNKKILTLMTMKEVITRLPDHFQKVHRSYIVNINWIDAINGGEISLGEHLIPVSESMEQALIGKLNFWK
ncbi:MAG: response regulator transcription factor [Cyclobacteriaceae bacterium]